MDIKFCPKCGKEVVDGASCCVYCGFLLLYAKRYTETIANNGSATYDVILVNVGKEIITITTYIMQESGVDRLTALTMQKILPCTIKHGIEISKAYDIKKRFESKGATILIENSSQRITIDNYDPNKLYCPRCGSEIVAVGQRGFNMWTGFLGSNKTVNRCGKCGCTWEPSIKR